MVALERHANRVKNTDEESYTKIKRKEPIPHGACAFRKHRAYVGWRTTPVYTMFQAEFESG